MSLRKTKPPFTQSLSAIQVLTFFYGFGFDIQESLGFMVVRHDAINTVKTVLEDNDILIPFPIRTLDFNAKGGDKLNAMINQKEERGTGKANSTSTQTTSDKKAGNDSDQPGEE
jgi:hypothetical protein